MNDISAEIKVPNPPSNIIVNSVHKETEPAIQKPGCHFALDDSIKYAIIDISFNIEASACYAILLEGTGFGSNYMFFSGFADFSVTNNNVMGFNSVMVVNMQSSKSNMSWHEKSRTVNTKFNAEFNDEYKKKMAKSLLAHSIVDSICRYY